MNFLKFLKFVKCAFCNYGRHGFIAFSAQLCVQKKLALSTNVTPCTIGLIVACRTVFSIFILPFPQFLSCKAHHFLLGDGWTPRKAKREMTPELLGLTSSARQTPPLARIISYAFLMKSLGYCTTPPPPCKIPDLDSNLFHNCVAHLTEHMQDYCSNAITVTRKLRQFSERNLFRTLIIRTSCQRS